MPKDKKSSARDDNSANAIPWKNSLLAKERVTELQNPMNYFLEVIQNNDTFAILFEEILDCREEGRIFQYDNKMQDLRAFLVVQDSYGTNWICPVFVNQGHNTIAQKIHPLDLKSTEPSTACTSKVSFGTMEIGLENYIAACSRGFEYASKAFLGDKCVHLTPDHSLIAGFYFQPK